MTGWEQCELPFERDLLDEGLALEAFIADGGKPAEVLMLEEFFGITPGGGDLR